MYNIYLIIFYQQLIEFGEGKDLGSATRTYEQQIEKTKANIKWMNENAEDAMEWLEDNIEVWRC